MEEPPSTPAYKFIVNDRNLGKDVPQTGVALNFTTAAPTVNEAFKGDGYISDNYHNACSDLGDNWKLPSFAEWTVILAALKTNIPSDVSTFDGIWYLNAGDGKTYFPLSGEVNKKPVGCYWDNSFQYMMLHSDGKSQIGLCDSDTHFVRCVKTVTN